MRFQSETKSPEFSRLLILGNQNLFCLPMCVSQKVLFVRLWRFFGKQHLFICHSWGTQNVKNQIVVGIRN